MGTKRTRRWKLKLQIRNKNYEKQTLTSIGSSLRIHPVPKILKVTKYTQTMNQEKEEGCH